LIIEVYKIMTNTIFFVALVILSTNASLFESKDKMRFVGLKSI